MSTNARAEAACTTRTSVRSIPAHTGTRTRTSTRTTPDTMARLIEGRVIVLRCVQLLLLLILRVSPRTLTHTTYEYECAH